MQVLFDKDEAWSLMMLSASFAIDSSGVSPDGKTKLRRWRSDRGEASLEMADLTDGLNKAIGAFVDEQTNRQVRGKGRYKTKRDA